MSSQEQPRSPNVAYRSAACRIGTHRDCTECSPAAAPTGVPLIYETCDCQCHAASSDMPALPIKATERHAGMTAQRGLRLLPWAGPDGKPCYLSTDDPEGYMSRLADHIESVQLGMARELLEEARQVPDGTPMNVHKLSLLAGQLAGALRDVIRVATSRGERLALPGDSEDE